MVWPVRAGRWRRMDHVSGLTEQGIAGLRLRDRSARVAAVGGSCTCGRARGAVRLVAEVDRTRALRVALLRAGRVLVRRECRRGGLDDLRDRQFRGTAAGARPTGVRPDITRGGTGVGAGVVLTALSTTPLKDLARRRSSRTPESTAAAVSYVAAKLSLLADGSEYARHSGVNVRIGASRRCAVPSRATRLRHRGTGAGGARRPHRRSMRGLCSASAIRSRVGRQPYRGISSILVVLHHAAEWPASTSSPMAAIGHQLPLRPPPFRPAVCWRAADYRCCVIAALGKGRGQQAVLSVARHQSRPVSIMTAEPATPPPSAAPSSPAAGAPSEAAGKPPSSARKPAQAHAARPVHGGRRDLSAPLPIRGAGAALALQ